MARGLSTSVSGVPAQASMRVRVFDKVSEVGSRRNESQVTLRAEGSRCAGTRTSEVGSWAMALC